MMKVTFENSAIEDLKNLSVTNLKLLKKAFEIIDDILKSPFEGKGKPEPLKHNYKGYWSRRISDEHRIVYKVESDKNITVVAVQGHYE